MFTIVTLHSSLLRSILGILFGLLFILWPQASVTYLIVITGIFFVLAGVCSILTLSLKRNTSAVAFAPRLIWGVAAGSLILGMWLMLSPAFFAAIFGSVWGVLLVVAGVQQIISLVKARAWYAVPLGYYVLPGLIVAAGVAIAAYPWEAVVNVLILSGVVSLFYGLGELVSWYKFRPAGGRPPAGGGCA
jgi:hypothetical protein